MFYRDSQNRFILLIEEIRAALLSGMTLDSTIKYFSGQFSEFVFLKKISDRLEEGKEIAQVLAEETVSAGGSNKKFIEALGSGQFANQRLTELRDDLLKKRGENFEKVSASIMKRIGILAVIALIPAGVYFLSGVAALIQSSGVISIEVPDSMKLLSIILCSVAFAGVLWSVRLKNG